MQHKLILATLGLDRHYRPYTAYREVRFWVINEAEIVGRDEWLCNRLLSDAKFKLRPRDENKALPLFSPNPLLSFRPDFGGWSETPAESR